MKGRIPNHITDRKRKGGREEVEGDDKDGDEPMKSLAWS